MRIARFIAAIWISCILSTPAAAAQSRTIYWSDLRPSLPDLESPFASLTPIQLEDMRTHVGWLTSTSAAKEDSLFRQKAEAALVRLKADGIDVEDLLKQRRQIILQRNRVALDPNPDVLGERVRLPGYLVPLSFDGLKVTEFLLVPTAGACIHTPPPPPNQIVHVTYAPGFEFAGLFEAVWVEGQLEANQTSSRVSYSDGTTTVQTNYGLDAGLVEKY